MHLRLIERAWLFGGEIVELLVRLKGRTHFEHVLQSAEPVIEAHVVFSIEHT